MEVLGGPKMKIRKDVNGSYSVCYLLANTSNFDWSCWLEFKKDLNETEIETYIKSYFDNYMDLPLKINFTINKTYYKGVKNG